jgi:hypothetical protein
VPTKPANWARKGYVRIDPLSVSRLKTLMGKSKRTLPQLAHHLVVRAFKRYSTSASNIVALPIIHGLRLTSLSNQEFASLLGGWSASHLCGVPMCIEPEHIHVEFKDTHNA